MLPGMKSAALFGLVLAQWVMTWSSSADSFQLSLRTRTGLVNQWESAQWEAAKTAVIICDMWDSHHSVTAVRRVNEMAPRLNEVLLVARKMGATIIHAPSDCMPAYADHPARLRALETPRATRRPPEIAAWCHRIPSEEAAVYPIDQSDGGEDESVWENRQWAARLEAEGRNPGTPWLQQHGSLEIGEGDFIAAEGDVVWNILQAQGIRQVILAGVHTNMCVLGRPFGLRRMVDAGMKTALLRDCTDVMYNPARWPYVSHFTGLDYVIDHIESHVCPTISSAQIVGGRPFRFRSDVRPRLVALIAERQYNTAETIPAFARRFLGGDFRVNYALAPRGQPNMLEGASHIKDADLLLVSVRRRSMPEATMRRIREHVAAGKPLLGIGAASQAFAPESPENQETWPEFGAEAFGGAYRGHHGDKGPDAPDTHVWRKESDLPHPVLSGLPSQPWMSASWLHKTAPLAPGTETLLMGRVEGREAPEPVAWTFTRNDGGRSFYTSLGHPDDFADPRFQRLLVNAVYWSAGLSAPAELPEDPDLRRASEGWAKLGATKPSAGARAFRTLLRAPSERVNGDRRSIRWGSGSGFRAFLNGAPLVPGAAGEWRVPGDLLEWGDLNLLVLTTESGAVPFEAPRLVLDGSEFPLKKENFEAINLPESGDVEVAFPIPPQFGAPTDLIQSWPTPSQR